MQTRLFFAFAIVAGIGFTACNQQSNSAGMTEMPPPAVTVSQPKIDTVTEFIEFSGKTRASQMTEVRAKADGYITQILFQEGGQVNQGDVLFVIDPSPFKADLQEAKANLNAAIADHQLAETLYKSRKSALADDAVSSISVTEAKAQADQASAAIDQAKARLERAELNLSYTKVRAPISGKIGRHMMDIGTLIQPGSSPVLATITAQSPIHVYFNLSEDEFLRFQSAIQASNTTQNALIAELGLANQEGYPFKGTIDFIDTQVDSSSGTLQMRALFANQDQQLVPGLFARVRMPIATLQDALLVPETSIGTDQQGRFLLLASEQSTVDYRPVQVGAQVDNNRVITSGITPQDRVIVKGAQKVRPGMPISIIEAENAANQAGNSTTGGGQ